MDRPVTEGTLPFKRLGPPLHEAALEPELPIVDPHHHLWDLSPHLPHLPADHALMDVLRCTPRYQLEELCADMTAGHDVRATVYMECGTAYRPHGPEELRPVGEIEFANHIAELSASNARGAVRACAGIVGYANLLLGDPVARVLDAECAAGKGRLRGVRHMSAHDADPAVLGPTGRAPPGMLGAASFREGFAHLERRGLSFDAWVLEPQLPEVLDLARAFPGTSIVLDHLGTPVGIASYEDRRVERFATWSTSMRALARCPNVTVKSGGLGNPLFGTARGEGVSSTTLAEAWRPYVVECIEVFGPDRCMFESNFPVDRWIADYVTLWNAFKRITATASAGEKSALYSGTAARVYRLEHVALSPRAVT